MCMTATICWCVGSCFLCGAMFSGLFGALMIPAVADWTYTYAQENLNGIPFTVVSTAVLVRHFAYCAGDYLGCVKQEAADQAAKVYGWENGIAVMPLSALGIYEAPLYFSHAQYRNVTYNPTAGRPSDALFLSKMSNLPEGVLASENMLLHLDTGTAEHTARRKLLADAMPSFAYDHVGPALMIPPGVTANAAAVFGHGLFGLRYKALKRAVFDTIGLNLFNGLFGVDISEHLEAHFEYDGLIAPVALGAPVTASQGKRLAEIRAPILAKMKASKVGKEFMDLAEERGMNKEQRIGELQWIIMFAGYGGTGNLAFETVKHVLKKPAEYVKLFRSNPEAFMLEAARFYPPVGGMNPMAVTKPMEHKLLGGKRSLKLGDRDKGICLTSNANMDPQVFKDPKAFRPGRENALRLMSWNNELGDFRECASVAGCPEAPRTCPGAHFSLRVATKTVEFFIGGIEEALKTRNEL